MDRHLKNAAQLSFYARRGTLRALFDVLAIRQQSLAGRLGLRSSRGQDIQTPPRCAGLRVRNLLAVAAPIPRQKGRVAWLQPMFKA